MNKKFRHVLMVGAVAMACCITGCASTGNESIRAESGDTLKSKIVEGRTTRAQIQELFGAPTTTSFTDSGLEIWTYSFTKMSADAISYVPIVNMFGASSSGTKKSLVVMFDKQNIVQRYAINESAVTQKTGLLNH
ncbi:MAG: outer membrane protein assembly factor BamE [Betaproteobacteria bacterium]|nr:outer membrane protein assembly factor BamE [Betaproteobacteria bacterium]